MFVSGLVVNDRAHQSKDRWMRRLGGKILLAACLLIGDHIAGSETVSSWISSGGLSTVKYLFKFLGYKTWS